MTIETLRYYLVRHGITHWNQSMRMQGQTDIPLNAEGRDQAKRIASRLAGMDKPPEAIWASDLSRARETAEVIAAALGLQVQTSPLLREMMLGDWEGLNLEEIEARGDGDLFRRYRLSPTGQRPPNGETLQDGWTRMVAARDMVRVAHPTGQVAIVGHGGTLRALLAEALDAPVSAMTRFALGNTSLSLIEETRSEGYLMRRVLLVNDTSHL